MRLFAAVAAVATLLFAVPAVAQKAPPPPAEPLRGDLTAAEDAPATYNPADPENIWLLDLSDGGRVTIALRPDHAPKMVERIKTLTRKHFYDGLVFHRVIDDPLYMAQGGDPKGDGTGDSGMPDVPAEFSRLPHLRGTVSAARKGWPDGATPEQIQRAKDSANSQFFIMMAPHMSFDENYTVFGRVTSGMQWVDKIERGEPPVNPTRILHAYIAADNPPAYVPAPAAALPAGEAEVTLPGTAPPQ
jgi:cyclophilin family peptidyl-prolyl cis-trans isomerase